MVASMFAPILALILWTFLIWFWMYFTRIPAMRAAGLDPGKIKQKGELDVLPVKVKQIADNYNHLHEQPTIFYALAICGHLLQMVNPLSVGLAWAYVALRILHSLIQCTINYVPLRFVVFASSSLVLLVIAIREALNVLSR
jgi:hypothetical protein